MTGTLDSGRPSSLPAATRRARVDIAAREGLHRSGGNGSLRAAVFGVNDGLVSTLSLVMGVAGANPGSSFVLLSGVAGLLAGAFSMGAGEYVSMQTQRELFEHQLAVERGELERDPDAERDELVEIYRAKGLEPRDAEALAERIMRDPDVALDTMAREELGLDPDELGSPWGAAGSSFVTFSLGGLLPVVPFALAGGWTAVALSAALGALGLFGVGAALAALTGRNPVFSGGRMLAIGTLASLVTYAVGSLIGVSIPG